DVLNEIREHWDPIQEYLANLLAHIGTDGLVAEEVALMPGIDSIFLLTRILREIESDDYDTVIVDCAPTGATLRLLSLTDAATTRTRPNLTQTGGLEEVRRILATRQSAYTNAADYSIPTKGQTPQHVAQAITRLLDEREEA
ncbi:MAG: ArsA family ATPase, partial [bacterium]|nr:ArsA family ATPase [bacterium]